MAARTCGSIRVVYSPPWHVMITSIAFKASTMFASLSGALAPPIDGPWLTGQRIQTGHDQDTVRPPAKSRIGDPPPSSTPSGTGRQEAPLPYPNGDRTVAAAVENRSRCHTVLHRFDQSDGDRDRGGRNAGGAASLRRGPGHPTQGVTGHRDDSDPPHGAAVGEEEETAEYPNRDGWGQKTREAGRKTGLKHQNQKHHRAGHHRPAPLLRE